LSDFNLSIIEDLSLREKAAIFASIEKLIELKNNNIQPKEYLSGHLEDGIFELRTNLPDKISRSLYFYEMNKKIIFTHGFIKKSQKTPRNEIEKAKILREKYRYNDDNS
jgi:phage-related protein